MKGRALRNGTSGVSERTAPRTSHPGQRLAPAALAFVVVVVLVLAGVRPAQALTIAVMLAVQTAGGAAWWVLARGEEAVPFTEAIGMGLAIGTLQALLADQLLRTTHVASIAWALPALAGVSTTVVVYRRAKGRMRLEPLSRGEAAAVAAGVGIGLVALLPFWLTHPLRSAGWVTYNVDIPFHEALANSLSRFGPSESVLAAGHTIRYHWFAHAWAGLLTERAGADPFVSITRALPVVALVGTACIAWAWARRLSSVRWAPALAVVLVVGGGYVGAPVGAGNQLPPESPSQALAALWILGLSMVVTEHVAARLRPRIALALAAGLAVGCVGGKVSDAAVVAGGLGLMALGSRAWETGARRRTRQLAMTVGLAFLAAFLAVIAGGKSNGIAIGFQHTAASAYRLQPLKGPIGVILGTSALVLAVLARWAGLGPLLLDRRTRRSPEVVFALGAGVAGLAGTVLLTQPGVSQVFFALSASTILSIVSACGIGHALEVVGWHAPGLRRLWVNRRRPLVVALAAGGAAGVLATALPFVGLRIGLAPALRAAAAFSAGALVLAVVAVLARRRRVAWPRQAGVVAITALLASSVAAQASGTAQMLLTLPPEATAATPLAWRRGHADAARWLVATSRPSDIVATDRLCSNVAERPPKCESRSFLVSALTGRRTLIEGFDYGVGLGGLPDWALRRVELSMRFPDRPTPEDARALWNRGVRWMWVDPAVTVNRSWGQYASVGFANDVAIILRLEEPA